MVVSGGVGLRMRVIFFSVCLICLILVLSCLCCVWIVFRFVVGLIVSVCSLR